MRDSNPKRLKREANQTSNQLISRSGPETVQPTYMIVCLAYNLIFLLFFYFVLRNLNLCLYTIQSFRQSLYVL